MVPPTPVKQRSVPPQPKSITEYIALTARDDTVADVQAHLIRCGLDRERNQHRSPADLLHDSQTAMEQPSRVGASPTGALIPLRQCLERTILDLFNRCQGQEPGKNWRERVLSIGSRAGRLGIASGHFENWANVAADKIKGLSEAKDGAMTRGDVQLLYSDGLNFLLALLSAVDESRLRP